ncbi:MAG: hypothetical protein UCH84_07265 [Eubacterium sp.]|uniref:hypothetical protein n=1 Tax=uncultured Eubacterium sp. TaxID=165185 RepID=UPI00267766E0|nr:hypothetical protein [uncultured Eubacterium sp.]MEE0716380.1 hypothetical protein [Eubacterium sp.]
MLSIEQAGKIINGVFIASRDNDNSLLQEAVNSIENTISNPFFRALNSYGDIRNRDVCGVLKLSAEFLHKHYGNIPIEDLDEEGSEQTWDAIMIECDNMLEIIERESGPLSREYGKRVIVAILSLLEKDYKERRKKS